MKIRTNGIELFASVHGSTNLALVLLHYWGGSSHTWAKVIDCLPRDLRTVAVDLRGWGRSDAPAAGYALADMATDIEGVIASLKLTRYVLVGHSMGGKVAQLLASRHPNGLMGLVLVAPAPPPPLNIPQDARAMMANAYESREAVLSVIDQVLTAKPLTEADREQIVMDSLRGAPQAKVAWPNATSIEDISRETAEIDVPVAVIAGEADKVESVDWLKTALLSRLPQAVLHVLPGTGHLSPLEAPQEIAAIIGGFVAQFDATAENSIGR